MKSNKYRILIGLIFGMLCISISVFAHHSFAATYHEDRTVKIEGKLFQFQFRNPHSFVHIEVTDEQGVMQRWASNGVALDNWVGRA